MDDIKDLPENEEELSQEELEQVEGGMLKGINDPRTLQRTKIVFTGDEVDAQ